MAKKTNRTSHVMDLLTNGASGEAPEQVSEAPGTGQEKKSDVQSHTVTPAKVTVVDEGSINDRVSQEILGKLTEELDTEQTQANPLEAAPDSEASGSADASGTDTPAPVTASETDSSVPADAAPTPETASEAAPEPAAEVSLEVTKKDAPPVSQEVSEPSQDTQAPAPQAARKEPHPILPESHFENTTLEREYRFINVMERLLMRQNLETVLTQHNVCTCHRCMSDVCALALTGLPAKYVVTSKDSVSPLISYYENKFKIPVLTELIKACNRVRENPHHNRPE